MLHTIIVMLKSVACVVWRIDVDTFYLPGKLLFQRLERKKVVAMNEHIVKDVFLIAPPRRSVVGKFGIFDKNPRL